jgi:hypothetical protein
MMPNGLPGMTNESKFWRAGRRLVTNKIISITEMLFRAYTFASDATLFT